MRNRYHSLHSHVHMQILTKIFTAILVWRQGTKVREVFQLLFWKQVYSFVTSCPKSSPSKQRYVCRKWQETATCYSMKLLPYNFSFRCASATVGLSLWHMCFKSINSKYNFGHVILTMISALHRVSQPHQCSDGSFYCVFLLPLCGIQGTQFACLKVMYSTFLVNWLRSMPEPYRTPAGPTKQSHGQSRPLNVVH